MKYKMYFEDDYDIIEDVLNDVKDCSFDEWNGYDREGDTEDIEMRYDGDSDTEDPYNWKLIFGNTGERGYKGRGNYTHRVTYWRYYIFLFENGESVLMETELKTILEDFKDLIQKHIGQTELILNDDEAFVI